MNRTTMMILGGALLFVVIVAVIVSMKMSAKQVAAPPPKPLNEILVAARDLQTGDELKEEDAKWEVFPDGFGYAGVIKKADVKEGGKPDAYGKPLKHDVKAGEPITTHALIDASSKVNYLAATLQPGMRAMSISVKQETTVGGFVTPGDFVDVILNFQVKLSGDVANFSDETVQRFATETILSNVRVLAVDQNAKESAHEPKVGRTVTLEVSRQQAEKLALATTMGQLTLALRRFGDKDTEADKNPPLTTDVNTSRVIQHIYKEEAAGSLKQSNTSVRMYSGGSVTNVPVRPTSQTEMQRGE